MTKKSTVTQECICLFLESHVLHFLFSLWYWVHNDYSTLVAEHRPAHICKGFFKCSEHFDILLLQQGGIGACDLRQFSFQPDSYQERSYQDPSSNSEVQSWINLKSISRSSVKPTGADLRVWHWEENRLSGKQQYTLLNWSGWLKLEHLQFQPGGVVFGENMMLSNICFFNLFV